MRRIKLTFPTNLVTKPLIYEVGHRYKVVTNIRRAEVRPDVGWVILEMDGEDEEVESALEWMSSEGVRIDPVTGDIIEG
mgnify:CR=1 FL=1